MASKFLGTDYTNAIKQVSEYREMSDQRRQIQMLFAKRTQALVLELSIFKCFLRNHKAERYLKPYKIHGVFPPRNY